MRLNSVWTAGLAALVAVATGLVAPAEAQQKPPASATQPSPSPSQAPTPTPTPTPAPAATPGQATTGQPRPAPAQAAQQQQQQQQAGTVRANHGAWSIVCDTPAGTAQEQCAMMQNVIAEDRPEVSLSVVVLKTADRKARILRILTPLGVLLTEGIDLYIDTNKVGTAPYTRCFSEGCYVEANIDDELLKVLRAGKNAVFTVRESEDQNRIGIPVDMSGFAEGYDALP